MAVSTLARLISALSAECDELALRVDDMHRLLPGDGAKANAVDAMIGAQDVDYVQQHLAGLAEFLMTMAEMTPDGIAVDLEAPLSTLRLSDLRRRLSGVEDEASETRVRPGELELL